MHETIPSKFLIQATDGHPAPAAKAARRSAADERLSAAERVVLIALLRHAREKSFKARVFGDPTASVPNYPFAPGQSAGN